MHQSISVGQPIGRHVARLIATAADEPPLEHDVVVIQPGLLKRPRRTIEEQAELTLQCFERQVMERESDVLSDR